MPSFLSKAITPVQYIAPLDQNLVFGAMLQKQQSYNQGVSRVDSQLEALSNQEIINPSHKAYYDQKVAALTESINSTGGMDFSERSVLQQIGSLSGVVSKDARILGAIQDTKKIRKAQSQLELWKSDPKKYGNLWAAQNQFELDSQINNYAQDTSEKATFSGEATPYVDHPKLINDRLSQIRKQIQQSGGYQTSDGQYITTQKQLSDLNIRKIVEGEFSSDPRIGNQLRIDANYQYRNTPTDTREFQSARVKQLSQAKALLEQQANEYNNKGLLEFTTGTPEQQKQAREKHTAGLQQIRDQMNRYDQLIGQAGTQSRESQVLGLHLDNQLLSYQAKYALNERTLKADPNYSVNLSHQDRLKAMSQADDHFRIGEYNENQRLLGGWDQNMKVLAQKHEYDKELESMKMEYQLGLKKDKDGKLTATTPGTDLTVVDRGASGVGEVTLADMHQQRDLLAGQQNKDVQDLLISYIRKSNRGMADELGKQMRPVTDQEGNLTGFKYPTSIAPNVARSASQILDYYNDLTNGRAVDPTVAAQLDSPESRELIQKVSNGSMILKLRQDEVTKLNKTAQAKSGLNPQELNEMTRLQRARASNWQGFQPSLQGATRGGLPIMGTGAVEDRLKELESRYKTALSTVATDLGKTGQYDRVFLVTGKSAEKDSNLQRVVLARINQESVGTPGATNAERRNQLEKLKGKEITEMKIDPFRQEVIVRATDAKTGETVTAPVTFTGTADWNSVLPEVYRQQQGQDNKLLKDHLDKTGSLKNGKNPLLFTTKTSIPISVTPGKTATGSYDLGYMYQGVQLPIPMLTRRGDMVVPQEYQADPIGWSQSKLDNWLETRILPAVKVRYGLDATGKPIPGYKPTLADLHKFFSDPDLF